MRKTVSTLLGIGSITHVLASEDKLLINSIASFKKIPKDTLDIF